MHTLIIDNTRYKHHQINRPAPSNGAADSTRDRRRCRLRRCCSKRRHRGGKQKLCASSCAGSHVTPRSTSARSASRLPPARPPARTAVGVGVWRASALSPPQRPRQRRFDAPDALNVSAKSELRAPINATRAVDCRCRLY